MRTTGYACTCIQAYVCHKIVAELNFCKSMNCFRVLVRKTLIKKFSYLKGQCIGIVYFTEAV